MALHVLSDREYNQMQGGGGCIGAIVVIIIIIAAALGKLGDKANQASDNDTEVVKDISPLNSTETSTYNPEEEISTGSSSEPTTSIESISEQEGTTPLQEEFDPPVTSTDEESTSVTESEPERKLSRKERRALRKAQKRAQKKHKDECN